MFQHDIFEFCNEIVEFLTAVASMCAYFIYLPSILKLFMESLIKSCCFSLVDLYFVGEFCLGAVGQSFL